jgi:hypothetical protein
MHHTLLLLLTTRVLMVEALSPFQRNNYGERKMLHHHRHQQYNHNLGNKYLDSLSGSQMMIPPPEPEGYEAIVPEEYYGLTNPMANNWAGSKHEEYGGYLHNLVPSDRNRNRSMIGKSRGVVE